MTDGQTDSIAVLTRDETSSSAVAEKLRDAVCPSVVSLNKIITRAECFTNVI